MYISDDASEACSSLTEANTNSTFRIEMTNAVVGACVYPLGLPERGVKAFQAVDLTTDLNLGTAEAVFRVSDL